MEQVMLQEKPSPSPSRNSHALLLNNPFGKKTTQKTWREGPVICLALPRKVLATSHSYSEEFRINPAVKGGWQVGCDKASAHRQVSHDAAGVSGLSCFAPPYP